MSIDNMRPAIGPVLVPTKSDVEVAKDLRLRIEGALVPVLELLNEARAAGFDVAFNLGPVYGNRIGIVSLKLIKEFGP